MISKTLIGLLFISICISVAFCEYEDDSISKVTYGSVIKLSHKTSQFRLHSHKVSYGSGNGGSGQQSVTGFPENDDSNSFWVIKAKHGERVQQGTVVKNGDIIRLSHVNTKKNLHSHLSVSPLTRQNEVSCFGDNGEGDTGDNWEVQVEGKEWMRGQPVRFYHVDTKAYLHASPNSKYQNPIPGQIEVAGSSKKSDDNLWTTEEGIYFGDDSK
ncbi:hypothetical protein CYY_003648 [Polysphondylium violaceum]|uniref:MIR domain-containing protein n=1 Tax=Polysphondylium violaceum TaxID=133409 RepID=A0A8J4PVZ1_9MYCE|nr:hypothetical protein CYY_003648 [Polysphondylium violaceum]